jgi:archaellum biogenesis ATPase FlaH
MNQINETELRKAIQQLHPDGELFEVRIIPNNKKKPASGYFKDVEKLIEAFKLYDLRETNVYITLNQVNSALFSRQQSNHFVAGANSTQDSEVSGYKWLFIDLDPERPTGISSTQEELEQSYKLAAKISKFLQEYGFEEPVKAISGNGAHLLYRINLKQTEENNKLVERCLKALSMLFDTDSVKVDTANFNPSRVCKLYGTLAQKGSNTTDRPHRFSRIIGEVKEVKPTSREYLEKLANELPDEAEKPKPTAYNNYKPSDFDIEDWMSKYGIRYTSKAWNGGTKYVLEECPFDSSHKAPDSMITKSASGAIGFKCLHNHCQQYHWKDLRLKFEPDAYEYSDNDRRIEEGWAQHNRDKAKQETVTAYQKNDDLPTFQNPEMILERVEPDPEYIRSGINKIDKAICGLEKGRLSIVSGLRASAKSTVLSEIILNTIEDGHVCVAYSGELSDKSFMNWMYLQAAGKGYIKQSAKYENNYYVEYDIKKRIAQWMGDKLWLYNNVKSNLPSVLLSNIRKKAIEAKADLIVIDNLMAVDVHELNKANELDAQTKFLWELKRIATDCNCHVILVAHPRKTMGFLRLEDVAGSNNIVNIIDNAFIIHRNNVDFREKSKTILKGVGADWMIDEGSHVTNVIEIAKEREHGTCDIFIDLYYEVGSKRLKNYPSESIVYGWNDDFEDVIDEEIPFD